MASRHGPSRPRHHTRATGAPGVADALERGHRRDRPRPPRGARPRGDLGRLDRVAAVRRARCRRPDRRGRARPGRRARGATAAARRLRRRCRAPGDRAARRAAARRVDRRPRAGGGRGVARLRAARTIGVRQPDRRDRGIRPGTSGVVVVCGHLDTFYNTVGAYDNGSGSIALLELARLWATSPPPRPVRIVWFTAEEWRLLGSRHHVEQLDPAARDAIDFVLNIDGLGRGDHLETFVGPERFGFAVRDAIREHARATARTLTTVDRFPPTRGTDDASFHAAGIPSVFCTFNDLHRLHQPEDVPDPAIARNIAWTVPLARSLAETMPRPERAPAPGLL
ncbi:M28 family metallopeptidase [Curtobacterium flaccumfaciens]|nr:M28 family metallopeptidase [Curtobacterium flaccumfaciens]